MRTTVRLPDELYEQVRTASREQGETVTSFLERALRDALHRSQAPRASSYRIDAFDGGGVLLQGVDLADQAGLLDVMESDAGR